MLSDERRLLQFYHLICSLGSSNTLPIHELMYYIQVFCQNLFNYNLVFFLSSRTLHFIPFHLLMFLSTSSSIFSLYSWHFVLFLFSFFIAVHCQCSEFPSLYICWICLSSTVAPHFIVKHCEAFMRANPIQFHFIPFHEMR